MSMFVKALDASTPKSEQSKQIAVLYAVILVVMAVAQLFTFDTFMELVASFHFPLPETAQFLIAPLLIVCEIFALPFLLRMRLSPAFRVLSMGCSWLVPVKWFLLTLWVVNSGQPVESIGFLGSIGELTPGWWAVLLSVSLGIMAAWSSWGLWPFRTANK